MTLEADVRTIVGDRPGTFGIYARNLTTDETVGVNADLVMNAQSTAKTFILVHYAGLVAAGTLDPAHRITVTAVPNRRHASGDPGNPNRNSVKSC